MRLYLLGLFATDIFNCSWSSYLHSEILNRYDIWVQKIYTDALKQHSVFCIWVVNSSCQSVEVPKLSTRIANNSAGTSIFASVRCVQIWLHYSELASGKLILFRISFSALWNKTPCHHAEFTFSLSDHIAKRDTFSGARFPKSGWRSVARTATCTPSRSSTRRRSRGRRTL